MDSSPSSLPNRLFEVRYYVETAMLDTRESYRTVTEILGTSEATLRLHYEGRTGIEKRKGKSDPVLGGEGGRGDLGNIHCPERTRARSGFFPSHHRTRATSDDLEELVPLDVGDLSDEHTFGHVTCSATSAQKWWTRP